MECALQYAIRTHTEAYYLQLDGGIQISVILAPDADVDRRRLNRILESGH